MGKHVKQLSTSDVMVTLIKQQNTQDATQDLKKYLYNTSGAAFQKISEAEEMIILPDFAGRQISQQQLLCYHLQKNHQKENHILNYESLLEGVDAKMKKIIQNSSQSFLTSNQIINQLILKLSESSQFITSQRKPISSISHHVNDKYIVIAKKMQKIKNIEKTLDVMKFWNETKISAILTIHPQNIHTYDKIQTIFQAFDNIVVSLNQKKHLFANFFNLLHLVSQRKNAIIYKIYLNMLNCVISYSNQKDLAIKFGQYQFIISNNLFSQIQTKKHQKIQLLFIQQSFLKLIDANIQELSSMLLYRYKVNSNIETLKEDDFIAFYDHLIIQYSHYFTNWHKVTTFHIQHQTKFKQLFIKYRTLVFQKMLEKIEISLKYSGRLAMLGIYKQIKLFNYIRNFIDFGQQWMGKCKSSILKLLEQKQKQEVSDFFKTTNGTLKNSILEQFKPVFSRQKQLYSGDFSKIKTKFFQQASKMFEQTEKFRQSNTTITKTDQFERKPQSQKYEVIKWQTLETGLLKYTQKINSHFGLAFFKAITQYQLRQQHLQDCQLIAIYQHLEYVLILLYKMYVPNYMKNGLQNQIFNDVHRTNKINNIKFAIAKNAIDEDTIFSINQLRHIFLDRSSFGPLYDFIFSCGNRYQGMTGNVNTNLLFQQPQKYQAQLLEFSQIFSLIANQLYIIVQYVDFLANSNRFKKLSYQLTQKIAVLQHVIQGLVLIYFTSYFQLNLKKYYRLVVPIFQGIKFEMKKKNETISNLKDYRSKMAELYQKFNWQKFSKHNIFYMMIVNKQVQYFYKFALDLFSKIQKINDDGRQILKQEPSQMNKITGIDKSTAGVDSWPALLDFYIEISKQKNEKNILQAAEKMMLNFPVQWWKSNLIWYYNDCSTKQKKQFMLKLVNVYLIKLISLPQI